MTVWKCLTHYSLVIYEESWSYLNSTPQPPQIHFELHRDFLTITVTLYIYLIKEATMSCCKCVCFKFSLYQFCAIFYICAVVVLLKKIYIIPAHTCVNGFEIVCMLMYVV